MQNKPLEYVSNNERKEIIEAIWKDIHDEQPNLSPQTNPNSYIIGGQPGAGKSTSTDKLYVQYNGNIVTIDLDQYREQHPNYKALYEKYGKESAEYTHEFASKVKEEIQKLAVDAKYNIIVDGTLKNVNKAEKLIDDLKDKGYKIDVLIHTCPKDVSWESVNTRYENALKNGRIPRYVPKHIHDQVVEVLPRNANKLAQSKQIESLTIHNREKKLYDSKVDKRLPAPLISQELNRNDKNLSFESRLNQIKQQQTTEIKQTNTLSMGKGKEISR